MTNPISYATPLDARPLPFTDRRTSILVVGVFLILMGALSGCIGVASPVGMLLASVVPAPRGGATGGGATRPVAAPFPFDWRTAASAMLIYAAVAVFWIWVGIGAVKTRRWVRPLMLIVGWTWLVSGVVGVVYWAVQSPGLVDAMAASAPPGSPRPPVRVFQVIFWSTGVAMTLFMVVLPALLVWLFSRKGVRETVEHFDPVTRWTDRCPMPVLAVSLWLVAAAAACLMYTFYAVLPLAGVIVTGPLAAAGTVLVAAVFAVLAWQTYRLRPAAWWGALVVVVLWATNTVWTFSRTGWAEFYRQSGYSPQQTELMMRYSGGSGNGMLWVIGFWTVVLVAYLMYARKYFRPADSTPDPTAPPAPPAPPAEPTPS